MDKVLNNLLVFEIFYSLKTIDSFIPLIQISLDAIPAKIILNTDYDINNTENKELESISQELKFSNSNKDIDMEELKKALIKKYSPFKKEDHPEIKYPKPGEQNNLYFYDSEIIPGKEFQCLVLIDSEGNIIRFVRDPLEMLTDADYDEIYGGLVGQLFDFQK